MNILVQKSWTFLWRNTCIDTIICDGSGKLTIIYALYFKSEKMFQVQIQNFTEMRERTFNKIVLWVIKLLVVLVYQLLNAQLL